jgi:magnesium transporter
MAGALLGILMMIRVVPFAWWRGESPLVGLSVGMSLLAITTLAATAGAAFPLLFDRMGLDPALMSTPFITTCTDVAGTLIYLKTAEWLLVHLPQLLRPQVFLPKSPRLLLSESSFTFLRSTLYITQRSAMAPAAATA